MSTLINYQLCLILIVFTSTVKTQSSSPMGITQSIVHTTTTMVESSLTSITETSPAPTLTTSIISTTITLFNASLTSEATRTHTISSISSPTTVDHDDNNNTTTTNNNANNNISTRSINNNNNNNNNNNINNNNNNNNNNDTIVNSTWDFILQEGGASPSLADCENKQKTNAILLCFVVILIALTIGMTIVSGIFYFKYRKYQRMARDFAFGVQQFAQLHGVSLDRDVWTTASAMSNNQNMTQVPNSVMDNQIATSGSDKTADARTCPVVPLDTFQTEGAPPKPSSPPAEPKTKIGTLWKKYARPLSISYEDDESRAITDPRKPPPLSEGHYTTTEHAFDDNHYWDELVEMMEAAKNKKSVYGKTKTSMMPVKDLKPDAKSTVAANQPARTDTNIPVSGDVQKQPTKDTKTLLKTVGKTSKWSPINVLQKKSPQKPEPPKEPRVQTPSTKTTTLTLKDEDRVQSRR